MSMVVSTTLSEWHTVRPSEMVASVMMMWQEGVPAVCIPLPWLAHTKALFKYLNPQTMNHRILHQKLMM